MKLFRLFLWFLFVGFLALGILFVNADEFDGLEEITLEDFWGTGDQLSVNDNEVNVDLAWEELDVNGDEDNLDFWEEEFDVNGGWEELDFGEDDSNVNEDEFDLFSDTKVSVVVDNTTENSVKLSFDKVWDYTDYKVLYARVPLSEAPIEEVLETNTTLEENATTGSVLIEGLEPQTNYYLVVVAMDDTGVRNDDTQSEEIQVFTENTAPAASTENYITNVNHEVNNLSADVTFTAGSDVATIWVYVSDTEDFSDDKVEIDAKAPSYTVTATNYGTKYVRLLPISKEGIAGEPTDTEVIVFEEPAVAMWEPKTGPALDIAILFALLASMFYVVARRKA